MAVTPSGKDKIATSTRLYVGAYDLSGDMMTIGNAGIEYETTDMTGMSEDVRNAYSIWPTIGITGYQAFMNDATGGAFTRLKLTSGAQTGTQVSLCLGGAGLAPAVGDPAYFMSALEISDNLTIAGAGILQGDFIADAGQATGAMNPSGVVLRGDTSLSATLAASSAVSHDNEGSTANGWHATIHVLATASGNFAFKLRHSADDSAWADLTSGAFTTTGGSITSESISGTGTVNQYVALDATRTAGTVTVIVVFSRN